MSERYVYNPARSQTSPGEWVESWKEDTIHDAITAQTPPKGRPLVVETWALALRGREDGAEVEMQQELAYSLRTPGGGASVQSILPTADSHARTSAWPASGPVLGATVAVSGLSSTGCCANCGHDGRLLRMSLDFYPATADATLESFSTGWMNSGSMSRGRYWTRSTSESRNAAAACSLSQVLEDEVQSKFYLSAKAAVGILRRAERRERVLPTALATALRALLGE